MNLPRRAAAGNVIVAALVAITLVASLSATTIFLAFSQGRLAAQTRDRAHALAAAEAGAFLQFQAIRMGGGTTAIAGPFGGGTYGCQAPASLGSGKWKIASSGIVGGCTRRFELYCEEGAYPAPVAAISVQGPLLLTVVLPPVLPWKISGNDMIAPSLATAMDAPAGAGAEPAVYGMSVHPVALDAQRTAVAVQMALVLDKSQMSGKQVPAAETVAGPAGEGMNTVHTRDAGDPAALGVAGLAARMNATVLDGANPQNDPVFGTDAAPAAVVLEAGAQVNGTLKGNGVLVIRSSAVAITGDLRWKGLVIVESQDAVDINGITGGNVRIYGGLVIDDPQDLVGLMSAVGSEFYYSSAAVRDAYQNVLPPAALSIKAMHALD